MKVRVLRVERSGVNEPQSNGYAKSIDGDYGTHYAVSLEREDQQLPGTVRWVWPNVVQAGLQPRIKFKIRLGLGGPEGAQHIANVSFNFNASGRETLTLLDQPEGNTDIEKSVNLIAARLSDPVLELAIYPDAKYSATDHIVYVYEVELLDMRAEQHPSAVGFGW